jgi:hypothetical protein
MTKTKIKRATKTKIKAKAVSKKPTPVRRASLPPVAAGQIWRVGEQNLQVLLVGKLLVHYKLAPPKAVRVSNSVGSLTAVEKYLKTNKAVLLKTIKVDPAKY